MPPSNHNIIMISSKFGKIRLPMLDNKWKCNIVI